MAYILLADDQESVRNMLAMVLEMEGHAVLRCADGKEALDILKHQKYDLLVTDMEMPNMNGIQLIEKARSLYPNMPILLVSASPPGDHGADMFLSKPVTQDHLKAAVNCLLKK